MSEAELKALIIKQLESPLRPEDRADVIMRAITAYTNKRELQARIDELKSLYGEVGQYQKVRNCISDRITELKQELESYENR